MGTVSSTHFNGLTPSSTPGGGFGHRGWQPHKDTGHVQAKEIAWGCNPYHSPHGEYFDCVGEGAAGKCTDETSAFKLESFQPRRPGMLWINPRNAIEHELKDHDGRWQSLQTGDVGEGSVVEIQLFKVGWPGGLAEPSNDVVAEA